MLLTTCSRFPSPEERRRLADDLAHSNGWQAQQIQTPYFNLHAYVPTQFKPNPDLWVYIEGDGYAWATSARPSSDPTPSDPLVLRMALAQPQGNAAYLARPCQYNDSKPDGCSRRYWTEGRFAPEVIDAQNAALDTLKHQFGAQRLTLVGYSGGAAVALLLAARRKDIERLITVAGNLDHQAWTNHHRINPLSGSLNPVNEIENLKDLRQWYFVGEQDKVIPPFLALDFAARFPQAGMPVVQIEPMVDHRCCWVEIWPRLIKTTTGN